MAAILLPRGGMDVWYVDESMERDLFVVSAVSVPFMRPATTPGGWSVVWEDHFLAAREWRSRIRRVHGVPARKELHAWKLLSGRGNYRRGRERFGKRAAAAVFRWMLSELTFLQDASIITVAGFGSPKLYGFTRHEAVLYALLQRMQRAARGTDRLGFTFFDQGRGEYRKLYRKARVHLPTGSSQGAWEEGAASKNIPMNLFVKDGNFKDSKHSLFTQIADLLCYAAFLKAKALQGRLTDWQAAFGLGTAYDSVPTRVLNTYASRKDPQGIVWLK